MPLRHLIAVFTLAGLVVGLAACGDGDASPQVDTPEARFLALGRQVYKRTCITCHQADGRGIPGVYPTLHQTRWTEGDPGRLIRLVLGGMEGPIQIKGQTYDQLMTPLDHLTNEQIAAVLTFVRKHFENEAGAVTPEQVAAVRAANDYEEVWQPEELWQHTGIPSAADSTRAAQ